MMTCLRCTKPMQLSRVITYRSGPSKALYECTNNPNHVRILDVPDEDPDTHRQPDVPETPLATDARGVVIERIASC